MAEESLGAVPEGTGVPPRAAEAVGEQGQGQSVGGDAEGGDEAGTPARGNDTERGQARKKRSRRPTGLIRAKGLHFVNKMRNVGWIAGYTHPGDDNSFLLQQTANVSQSLRIEVGEKYTRLTKAAGRPVLVMVHARGFIDAQHHRQLSLHCISVDRPSMLDLPVEEVWASGFGHGAQAAKMLNDLARSNFSPFDKTGNIKHEYEDHLTSADASTGEFALDDRARSFLLAHKMLGEVLSASGGVLDSRLGRGQNYVSVAGFVDAKAWVDDSEFRKEYTLLTIRQHEDDAADIPVHVIGRMAKAFYGRVRIGEPVLIEGSARRKVIPNKDDPSQIDHTLTYIETDKVSGVELDHDILLPIPPWLLNIRDRLLAAREERAATATQAPSADASKADPEALGDEI